MAGDNLLQISVVQKVVLFELALDKGERELSPVDRNIQFREDPWQAADVVLVPVRQNDAAHLVAVLCQVADVRDDDVDPQQFVFRKHQAGVDDEDVILPAESHAVHPELAQPTQRNQLQLILCHES